MGLADEYVAALRQLLPRGSVWEAREGSRLRQVIQALVDLIVVPHDRARALLEELDPRITTEMLTDWERLLGLPGECGALGETLQQRRDAVLQRITDEGGQSRAYFIALAELLGHAGATIEEYDYFRADDPAELPVNGIGWKSAWTLHTTEDVAIVEFAADESTADEPLRAWGNEILECVIEHAKPAHTTVLFSYGS